MTSLKNSFWVKTAWFTLLAYFIGLAGGSKEFSYFHFKIGPIPVFIGELALFLSLVLTWVHRDTVLSKIPKAFRYALLVYLGWGAVLLPISILKKDAEIEMVQILRDSALFYQALWILFGLMLTQTRWKTWLTACLIGVGAAQFIGWSHYAFYGLVYRMSMSGFFGFIYGNESFSYLFPFTIVLWPTIWALLLTFAYGDAILGLFIIYFKKTWILNILAIAVPATIWTTYKKFGLKLGVKKISALATSLTIGLVLAGYVAQNVAILDYQRQKEDVEQWLYEKAQRHGAKRPYLEGKSELTKPMSIMEQIRTRTKDPTSFFFHGEVDEKEKVHPFVAYVAWRAFLWKQAWQGFLAHPFLGNGYGPRVVHTQLNGLPTVWEGKWISGPHNSFLTVAFRGGIIAIISLFVLLFSAIWEWIKTLKLSRSLPLESNLALAALLIQVVSILFNVVLENPQNGTLFWVLLGSLIRLTHPPDHEVI